MLADRVALHKADASVTLQAYVKSGAKPVVNLELISCNITRHRCRLREI